jgi:hypothetical protein
MASTIAIPARCVAVTLLTTGAACSAEPMSKTAKIASKPRKAVAMRVLSDARGRENGLIVKKEVN